MPGAVFTNVLLADEINRTPPRTQAALFEPMGERQVTVDGKAHKLPDPFLVIATQNPHEHEGVFPLPEGQLDRFLFKIELDYADAERELAMLNLPHKGIAPDMLGEVRPLLGVVGLDKARQELEHTEVPESVGRYIVAVGRRTRELPGVELGVSSRAMIHLVMAAKASARLNGRDVVTIEDVREMAPYVLRHRLAVKPGTQRRHRAARCDGRRADGGSAADLARFLAQTGICACRFGPARSLKASASTVRRAPCRADPGRALTPARWPIVGGTAGEPGSRAALRPLSWRPITGTRTGR